MKILNGSPRNIFTTPLRVTHIIAWWYWGRFPRAWDVLPHLWCLQRLVWTGHVDLIQHLTEVKFLFFSSWSTSFHFSSCAVSKSRTDVYENNEPTAGKDFSIDTDREGHRTIFGSLWNMLRVQKSMEDCAKASQKRELNDSKPGGHTNVASFNKHQYKSVNVYFLSCSRSWTGRDGWSRIIGP